jgi:hypothetical protein
MIRHNGPTGLPIRIDITSEMRCIEFLCLFFSEFQISELEFQFLDFSKAEFEKKNPTGIFGIKNRIGIPLPMGVPEIGTENWNSQPSLYQLPNTSYQKHVIVCMH